MYGLWPISVDAESVEKCFIKLLKVNLRNKLHNSTYHRLRSWDRQCRLLRTDNRNSHWTSTCSPCAWCSFCVTYCRWISLLLVCHWCLQRSPLSSWPNRCNWTRKKLTENSKTFYVRCIRSETLNQNNKWIEWKEKLISRAYNSFAIANKHPKTVQYVNHYILQLVFRNPAGN